MCAVFLKKYTLNESVEIKLEVDMKESKILSQSAVSNEAMKDLEKRRQKEIKNLKRPK